jgi:hemolysin activation/secretion protein
VYKSLETEIALGLKLHKSKSRTFLLDEPFAFTGSDDGVNEQTALRFSQEWVHRSLTQVMAVHSSLNFGLDMWNATILDREPDARFVSWLGQFQWIRQIDIFPSQLMFRLYCQWSDDPLLPAEKFSIGGTSTVRGYRQNLITTDNGIVSSAEWRIPVARVRIPGISRTPADGEILIIPFFDYGRGWNTDTDDPIPSDIYSIGIGTRWHIGRLLRAEIFWGYGLRSVDDPVNYDLQDDGIHFQISADIF